VRTLAFFSLAAIFGGDWAHAQTPLVKILSDELERNITALKQKADPAPYFLGYEVTDQEEDLILASRGSIDGQNHRRDRILDTTVRVGSPKSDNYRRAGSDRVRFTLPSRIAIDDNADSICKSVWLTTDRVYRGAAQRFIRLQSDEKLRSAAADGSDDFSIEPPQTFFASPPALKFNATEWAARLRKVSAEMSKYPGAINSNVAVETQRIMTTLVTSEGTRVETGRLFARLIITANGKASDGMGLGSM
jgi:TldD protein